MKKKIFGITIKFFYLISAIASFVIGVLGFVLPILPGIVFLILSVALLAKASEKFRVHRFYLNYTKNLEKYSHMLKQYLLAKRKLIIAHVAVVILILSVIIAWGVKRADAVYGVDAKITQAKSTNSATVYYLNHKNGTKKAYTSEQAFLAYGNKWSSVKTVSADALNKFSDIKLVKAKNNPTVYYIKNNQKALIKNEAEFKTNNFKWSDVATIASTDLATYQEVELSSLLSQGGTPAGGSLSADTVLNLRAVDSTIIDKTIVLGGKNVLVGSFNLSNPSNQAIELKNLKIKLKGVYDKNAITNMRMAVGNGLDNPYTPAQDGNNFYFSFASAPLAVNPGQNITLNFYVDTKYYQNWLGHSVVLSIENASDLNTNASVAGVFPTTCASLKFAYSDKYLGVLKIEEQSLSRTPEVIVGATEQAIGQFKISETTGSEDVKVQKLIFQNNGSAGSSDLVNFVLRDQSNNKISQVSAMTSDNRIIFNLSDYLIGAGKSNVLTVSADVKTGESKNINLQIVDFQIQGKTSGFGLNGTTANLNNTINVVRKTLSVLSNDLLVNGSVFAKQSGTLLGVFEIRNNNQTVDLDNLEVNLVRNSTAPALTNTIFLVNYKTGEVLNSVNPQGDAWQFNSANIKINSLGSLTVALITDMPDSAKQGDRYQATVSAVSYHTSAGNILRDAVSVTGAPLVVSKANLYIYKNSNFNPNTIIKGQKQVQIASFIIEAAAGDDIKINGLTLAKGDTSGLVTYDNGFSNLKVALGWMQSGKTISQPYSDSAYFDNFSYRLSAGDRVEVKVYADVASDLKVNSTQLMIANITATSNISGMTTTIKNINAKSNSVSFGTVKAELTATSGGQILVPQTGNKVASFTIKNTGDEAVRLSYIKLITSNDGFSNSLGYSNLRIVNSSTNSNVGSISKPVAGANRISLNSYQLATSTTANFDVYVDANANTPTDGFQLYFGDLEATGKDSKVSATLTGSPTTSVQVNNGVNPNPTSTTGSSSNTTTPSNNNLYMIWPVYGNITYYFGATSANGYPYGTHTGIDIATAQGSYVRSALAGTVTEVHDGGTTDASYIILKHANNLETVYGHLSVLSVKVGDTVAKGYVIGKSGGTPGTTGAGPNTTGAHLHFEVRFNGVAVDPMKYLN